MTGDGRSEDPSAGYPNAEDRGRRPTGDAPSAPPGAPPTRRRRMRGVDRGPQPIGAALDDVVRGFTPPARPAPAAATWGTVFSRWEDVVGPAVARHAQPLRLEAGRLVVAVDQPPWATQVRTLGPRILGRIAELTGERLERMEVVVRR